ncbi:azurin [Pedobacter sp. CAN_A7]|uniref:azurin n=1 Tax=Pedobacter sp. CAN_A7 TaxID=2787722 RepID=UPI001A224FA3
MKTTFNSALIAIAMTMVLFSCGDSTKQESTVVPTAETPTVAAEPVTPVAAELSNVISLEGNDMMQFNQTAFKVAAGQLVTLTLKHTGKMDKTAMGHNFVLLKPGTDLVAFSTKAMEAKDNEYIPKGESASILAHTKLLGGGESDTITFTVAEKGTYEFICSFPGHVSMMKGKLIVE